MQLWQYTSFSTEFQWRMSSSQNEHTIRAFQMKFLLEISWKSLVMSDCKVSCANISTRHYLLVKNADLNTTKPTPRVRWTRNTNWFRYRNCTWCKIARSPHSSIFHPTQQSNIGFNMEISQSRSWQCVCVLMSTWQDALKCSQISHKHILEILNISY